MLAYLPSLSFGFIYEDWRDSASILSTDRGLTGIGQELLSKPSRSLTNLSFWLTTQVSVQPWAFHAGNVLLHLLNTTLVYLVGLSVLSPLGAVLAAGVFGLHPLQVEAVAYVSSRSELLACAGVLLALLSASLGRVSGAVVGCLVAFLAKESAGVAWGLVPLWAWFTGAAFPVRRWLLSGIVLVPLGVWYALRFASVGWVPETWFGVVGLIGLWLVPVGFTIDHDWSAYLGFDLLLLVALVAWVLTDSVTDRRPWLSFALIWTVLALGPRFVLPLYEGLHEHHFLIPAVAWSLGAGSVLSFSRHEEGI
ncbi:MAG TPA: hypothetical protein VJ777_07875 [Mycobacterium sp.]|nr:hypothetical protein [Mycobacterium sp.]